MKAYILLFLCAVNMKAGAQNIGLAWNSVKIGNQSYVAIDEVASFYGLTHKSPNDKTLTLEQENITLQFTIGGYETKINGIKFLIAHPLKKHGGRPYLSEHDLTSLLDPVIRPKFAKAFQNVTTIILDAGHGGYDKGSADKESKLTLALALKIKPLLEKEGFRVVMTREKDQSISLAQRVRTANAQENAVMISLHFNSGDRQVSGFESYILSSLKKGNNTNAPSIALATAIHSHTVLKDANDSIKDRGIRRAKFHVLTGCKHPCVLIEAGFLTNKEEHGSSKIKPLPC